MVGTVFSQNKVLKGQITNTTDVEGIHVINQSSEESVVTNEKGDFTISAKLNDTILVSSIMYIPKRVIVSETSYLQGELIVRLNEMVNELAEVRLGTSLTGNLAVDARNIKTEKMLQFDDVGIPGFKGKPEEKIDRLVPSLGLSSAVDLEVMYKHLSGYY
ncbi:peptidase E, partial [unidentified eubacterium SCB49]